nr:hypothetical protein GCM10025730_49730 [Promicromonospora thailandica]
MDPQSSPSTAVRARGRHRAARRPALPVLKAGTGQTAAVASRGAVIAAAGSGVLLSLIAPPAQAAPPPSSAPR